MGTTVVSTLFLDDGLIVPVVHAANDLSHEGIAKRIKDLAARARDKTLKPDDVPTAVAADRTGPPPKRFGTAVHCLRIDRDGLVYVCDRSNNRIQIFRKDGTFQKEFFVANQLNMNLK